ncbi:UPF0261 domain-containing protein [Aureobasidium pullulans]|uniref:UPF0261 domain-containing protein n=1 Tax=Aureobasidium pullulans TaxID=5580 RepID=A0A4S9YQ47_AURPU|nr:UPF0261 domain-containing protein [Aureobasidium pullulans]THW56339.1 UPF0261 domain-containing protein [Aureobasidium pullulans]THZ95432.1 UPF0261 domain-containing protein [Aureobasidium pullulans]
MTQPCMNITNLPAPLLRRDKDAITSRSNKDLLKFNGFEIGRFVFRFLFPVTMPHIVLLGTLDTKLPEILYLHSRLLSLAQPETTITLIDCGRTSVEHTAITISQNELVTRFGPKDGRNTLKDLPRGEAIKFMISCTTLCIEELHKEKPIHGIISAGGSGGTSLASAVMRTLPIGLPKLIASTVASGDTGPIVGETDITLMYSVVDIAGTNELLKTILNNSAAAMAGMSAAYEQQLLQQSETTMDRQKLRVGITMFGVTTPCVDKIREHLESNHPVETYVFHATGHGGKAMERLIAEDRLDAVLDVTTTEICDLLMGGNMSAGPDRLEAALKAGIPTIISLGATDMVNFGPKGTVPEKYQQRKLFEHNPTVTLMRTTKDECKAIGEFIVDKVKRFATKPSMVQITLPKGGISMIATPGAAFEDRDADDALIETLTSGLQDTGIKIVLDERDINDEGFAVDIANDLMRLTHLR